MIFGSQLPQLNLRPNGDGLLDPAPKSPKPLGVLLPAQAWDTHKQHCVSPALQFPVICHLLMGFL